VQKFGTFLSGMIMPNIAAIIAWGLITAFVIPDGFTPNKAIQTLVDPMIFYLLPLLIAYTGGKMVYDVRGGVVGTVGAMGVIVGTYNEMFLTDQVKAAPMFLGAMIMGPLTAWLMKQVDSIWAGKIRAGFEMLVDNFSAGILAALMAIAGIYLLSPVMQAIMLWLSLGVGFLIENGLLPLTSLFIEPAKVFFLNTAINHGVLTPLETGKSVLFLLEANPGPGMGVLLAYMFFGKGMAKASAPGAAIIHFFGGIHEIYFPYVLMKPILLLATIAGGMTGVFLNVAFNVGLRAPASPGSIIAVYLQTASDSYLGVTVAVFGALAVSFLVAALLLRMDKSADAGDLSAATAEMEALKGKKSSVSGLLTGAAISGPIKNIVFACDAGMGSSAMGASVLRKKIKEAGYDVTVVNKAIANLSDTYDIVVVHQDLAARAAQKAPSAVQVSVDNFLASPRYDEVVEMVKESNSVPKAEAAGAVSPAVAATVPVAPVAAAPAPARAVAPEATSTEILPLSSIVLSGSASDQASAIEEAGALLVASGAVDAGYVGSMHDREKSVSTYMGNLLAIPHGTNEAKSMIQRSAISVVRYPEGIQWNGNPVKFVIGIAGANNEHLELLSKIAEVFLDPDAIAKLEQATTQQQIADTFGKVNG
jgi:PTS system mannitol-specific IIC component